MFHQIRPFVASLLETITHEITTPRQVTHNGDVLGTGVITTHTPATHANKARK